MAVNADGKIFIKTSKEGDIEGFPAQKIYKHIKTSFVKDNIGVLDDNFELFEAIRQSHLRKRDEKDGFADIMDGHQNPQDPPNEKDCVEEKWICKKTLWYSNENKVEYPFGKIFDYEVPLKTPGISREQEGFGDIDLVAFDEKTKTATILEAKAMMKRPNGKTYDNSDHPLKAFLEIYTYWKQVGGANAANWKQVEGEKPEKVFPHPAIDNADRVDKAVLFYRGSRIYKKFRNICESKDETDKKIKAFLRRLDVKVYTVEPSKESRWVFAEVQDETWRLHVNLTVHRGSGKIGGCIAEFATSSTRIFIDMGKPLEEGSEADQIEIPSIPGVTEPGQPCQGVFFTHYHADHMGFIGHILPDVPLYMGKTCRDIALKFHGHMSTAESLKKEHGACVAALERAETFEPLEWLDVGDMRIKPLSVDHSAFDAYMFLIEAEGRRILFTGDFRSHGERGEDLLPTIEEQVGRVDWLISEGTTLSRSATRPMTEKELKAEAEKIMKEHKNVFVLCSSTNVERLLEFFWANPYGRPVLCDDYQKEILELVRKNHGNQSEFTDLGETEVYGFYPFVKINDKLQKWMDDRGFLMFVRASDGFKRLMDKYRDDCIVIYSMWDGYLEGEHANPKFKEFLEGFPVIHLHTSGHADPETIRKVCRITDPRMGIIPVHGENPEAFRELAPSCNIVIPEDGKPIPLD